MVDLKPRPQLFFDFGGTIFLSFEIVAICQHTFALQFKVAWKIDCFAYFSLRYVHVTIVATYSEEKIGITSYCPKCFCPKCTCPEPP